MLSKKTPNKFQLNSKAEGMYSNLLPKAIYPDKVKTAICHFIKLPGWPALGLEER